ncbi:MAG: DegT/DnrJ/EryC1/StrS family aminotransferase [Pirellulaceae bacterium]
MTPPELVVPMFDYRPGHARYRDAIETAMRDVIASGLLILGPRVNSFEGHFAESLRMPGQAVGVGSGTDALAIALRALGVGTGDEVLTVPNTAIPTVSAIRMVGARPVFVDVDPDSCLMDIDQAAERITRRTRVLLPVHLFGNAVPMEPLLELATRHGLHVVEDCAQSTGTRLAGQATGTFGRIGCFSFYPTKTLGAYGDGGLCFTTESRLAETMRQLRMYGCGRTYVAEREGVCSRLDELQAAILDVKLAHLEETLAARREIARQYDAGMPTQIQRIAVTPGTDPAWQLYVIRVTRREALISQLQEDGIGYGIHYPVPIHLMPGYEFLGYRVGDFPVAERLAGEILSLPCFPGLTPEQVQLVCRSVAYFADRELA